MHLDVGHPTQRQIDKLNDIFLGYSLDSRGFHVTTMLASMAWVDLMGTCLHRLLAPMASFSRGPSRWSWHSAENPILPICINMCKTFF